MAESSSPYALLKVFALKVLRFVTHGSNLPSVRRFYMYLGITIAALMVIWIPVTVFLVGVKPSYYSNWTLILPGGGAGQTVSLESVGQATANVKSPYTSHSVDPKVNYKAIASSPQVLNAAAKAAGLSKEEYGKPVIKLVDQTALIEFRHSGRTGEEAYNKSEALFSAFHLELERLRNDEQERTEESTNMMLSGFRDKLEQAQQDTLEYQAQSSIVSLEQFAELTLGLERARTTLREIIAEHDGLKTQLKTLQDTLSIQPEMAFAAINLQSDPLYIELTAKYATAAAVLAEARAQWGEKNLAVITARDIHDKLKQAMLSRVLDISGHSQVDPEKLAMIGSSGDKQLFSKLIEMHSRQQGMASQIITLEASIITQQEMLEKSTIEASRLEDLKRKLQVATAVFTTALARIDLGKSDRFATYPMVQLFSAPEKPKKPDMLPRKLALVGAALGTCIVIFGLILLWIRKPYLQKILKNV